MSGRAPTGAMRLPAATEVLGADMSQVDLTDRIAMHGPWRGRRFGLACVAVGSHHRVIPSPLAHAETEPPIPGALSRL